MSQDSNIIPLPLPPRPPSDDPLDPLLDALLACAPQAREETLQRLERAHPSLAEDLHSFVRTLDDLDAQDAAALDRGKQIDRYVLKERLGKGSTAEVWVALDERMERQVALKLFKRLEDSTEAKRTTLEEARALVKLESRPRETGEEDPFRYLVQVFDVGFDQGYDFIAMELCAEQMSHGVRYAMDANRCHPPNLTVALQWWEQAAKGVGLAHKAGVFHGDIKPANVLVFPSKKAIKVTDFGLIPLRAQAHRQSGSGTIFAGTPQYMSPEQAQGIREDAPDRPQLLQAADMFGLGALFYHLVTGRPPYDAADGSLIEQALRCAPPKVSRFALGAPGRISVPKRVERVLTKAMSRSRSQRYSDATQLADDIRNLREKKPTSLERGRPDLLLVLWLRKYWMLVLNSVIWALAAAGVLYSFNLTAQIESQRWELSRRQQERKRWDMTEDDYIAKLAGLQVELRLVQTQLGTITADSERQQKKSSVALGIKRGELRSAYRQLKHQSEELAALKQQAEASLLERGRMLSQLEALKASVQAKQDELQKLRPLTAHVTQLEAEHAALAEEKTLLGAQLELSRAALQKARVREALLQRLIAQVGALEASLRARGAPEGPRP